VATAEKSLRAMIEYWLAPDPEMPVRVARFRNGRLNDGCYVRVEAVTSAGIAGMFFFRHKDGIWRVFPPNRDRAAMRSYLGNRLTEGTFEK
jgi:hypothetical protein